MNIIIEEQDIQNYMSEREKDIAKDRKIKPEAAGSISDKAAIIMKALPKSIAQAIANSEPDGFEAKSFEIEVSISGTPFGIGISSKGKISYTKKIDT